MAAAWLALPSAKDAGADSIPSGTVSASSGVITPSDSSACTVSAANPPRGTRAMNKGKTFAEDTLAWLFDARCDGGANNFEIRVHEDFTEAEAASAAQKYGHAVGRLPRVLRAGKGKATGVRKLYIHKGSYRWFATGWSGKIGVYTERRSGADYEEVMVHEAAHVSLDDRVGPDPEWLAAQKADGAYITPYAQSHPRREDVAESFLAYLAVRFRPSRISEAWKTTILQTIPNRIAYFDALLSADDMKPFVSTAPRVAQGEVAEDNPVSLSVSGNGAISEGDAALTVTATLGTANATGAALAIPVRVRKAGTTATAGDDYTLAGTISIPDGASSGATEFAVVDDDESEPGETVVVELGSPLPAGLAAGETDHVTIAIADNDNPVTLSVSANGAISEGDAALTVTATLGTANATGAALAIPVQVRAAGTTATAGDDYTLADTISIPDGASSGATAFAVVDDDEDEPGETVVVELGSPLPAGLAAGATDHVTITIADNDAKTLELTTAPEVELVAPAVTVALAAERTSVAEDNGEVKFTVTLSRALGAGETAVVPFTVTGGKAHRDWNIRFRSGDNGPGVKRTDTGHESAVTFTEGGLVATLVLIARPNHDTAERTIRIAFGTGERAPGATGVLGGITPVGGALSVAIVDDDAAAGPALWVKDERAQESAGAMRFTVRLSVPAAEVVKVRARTRNARPVSARAGRDYEPVRVDLRFRPGETKKHVRIRIFNDAHDEDRETFELVLSNAEGAIIADRVAVGTIENDDPLPAAYLARFGRTVAEQALDGIAGRMSASRTPGMQGTVAGQSLSFDPAASGQPAAGAIPGTPVTPGAPAADREAALAMAGIARGLGADASAPVGPGSSAAPFGDRFGTPSLQSRGMTARDALLGSSFSLTGQKDGAGGSLAFWGRASQGSFDGAERGDGTDISLDGTATAGMLGADYARGKWLVGLALTQSSSEGSYAAIGGDPCPDTDGDLCDGVVRAGDGDVEASLTAAIPYAALQVSERLRLWGAAGYGTGEVTLKTMDPGSGAGAGESYKADTTWTMAAAGVRGDLLEAPEEGSGPALALTSDALWALTSSDKTRDLAATDSDVTRLRLGLEGSYRVALDGEASLTPKLEIGARHDGGDAETGFGVEVGGGIAWVDPGLGLSFDVSGRTLLAHENDDLKDRGISASLAFDPDPATGRGPSFSLRQDFGGQAQGGLDALFAPAPLEDRTGSEATSRWAMEAAWGFPAFGGRFTGSPHVGLGLSTGSRDYSLGWRLAPEAVTAPDLSFGVRATRWESDTADPEHTIGFEITARW